jgi:hypothetical protein
MRRNTQSVLRIQKTQVKVDGSTRRVTRYIAELGEYAGPLARTVAEAREGLFAELARALTFNYDPILIPIHEGPLAGHIVVSRSPFGGWSYHFDREGHKSGWCMFGIGERAEVLAAAQRHAASIHEDAGRPAAEVPA